MNTVIGKQIGILTLIVMTSIFATGCNKGLVAENEALVAQNNELQELRTKNLALLGILRDENEALKNENADIKSKLISANTAVADANTGFGSIEDIDVSSGAHGEIIVRVPGDVLFAAGRINLRNTAKTTLRQIATILKRDYDGKTIRVEGYTDSDPIKKSGWKDNLELSLKRAAAVYRYLASQNVNWDIYAAGFGDKDPIASNSTADGKAKNRRVEIVVIMN